MFVETTRVLPATVHCVVNPLPAAKAASQYTRFLSSRAIKGSRLQSGAMDYSARASPFKAALEAALPKAGRKRAAADLAACLLARSLRSLGESHDSVTKRRIHTHTWSVRTPSAVKSRIQRKGRKRARVLKMSDRCHCCYDSYIHTSTVEGEPCKTG
jgi:hypothetical protein